MPLTYQGSDDNTLAVIVDEFSIDVTIPAGNTRLAIDAVAAAADVDLSGEQGSDRNALEALYAALAAGPSIDYEWDATPEETAMFGGRLKPTMSGGNLTATIELTEGLEEQVQYLAAPAGFATNTNNRLSVEGSGTVSLDMTLPAVASTGNPGNASYFMGLTFGAGGGPVILVTVSALGDLSYIVDIEAGGESQAPIELETAPEVIDVIFNADDNTFTIEIDGDVVVTATAYADASYTVGLLATVSPGITTGDGAEASATLSFTLDPVEAPGD